MAAEDATIHPTMMSQDVFEQNCNILNTLTVGDKLSVAGDMVVSVDPPTYASRFMRRYWRGETVQGTLGVLHVMVTGMENGTYGGANTSMAPKVIAGIHTLMHTYKDQPDVCNQLRDLCARASFATYAIPAAEPEPEPEPSPEPESEPEPAKKKRDRKMKRPPLMHSLLSTSHPRHQFFSSAGRIRPPRILQQPDKHR